jgi:hypothetical protein
MDSAREQRLVFAIITLFLLCISLPYAWAILITPPGWTYGGLLYNVDDQNVHLAWARQAYEGQLFFRDLFTHESLQGKPLFTNAFSWLVGILGRTGIPLVVIYHVLRLLFSAVALWWFWQLCRELTTSPRLRVLALATVAFSAGAGWLHPVWKSRVFIDRADGPRMMPEAWTFTSALIFPLMILSVFLLCVIYCQTLRAQKTGQPSHALYAALAALLLSNIHTYDVIPLNIILLLWAVASTQLKFDSQTGGLRAWLAPLIPILGTLPPLLYQIVVFRNSEEFRIKALTVTSPPSVLNLLVSFGFLLLLAAIGLYLIWRRKNSSELDARGRQITPLPGIALMLLWVVVTLSIIYVPLSFGRKMIEGVHLPLSFLAALGVHQLLKSIPASTHKVVAAGAVAFLSISSVNFTLWCLNNASENNAGRVQYFMPPLYLPPGDAQGLEYLNTANESRDQALLCLTFLGNYVPRETGRTVFLGHWAETLNYNRKLGEVARFYGIGPQQMSESEAREWLRQNNIGLVVVGFYEQQAGARLPLDLPLLQQTGETRIYRVPQN